MVLNGGRPDTQGSTDVVPEEGLVKPHPSQSRFPNRPIRSRVILVEYAPRGLVGTSSCVGIAACTAKNSDRSVGIFPTVSNLHLCNDSLIETNTCRIETWIRSYSEQLTWRLPRGSVRQLVEEG